MEQDKEEIAEQLKHHEKMLRIERRNLREREIQAAKHGLEVPPSINNHIHELKENIRYHEDQIMQLRILAVTDKEPLSEIEYRALLAETWDTPQARPTVAGDARLR